MIAVPELSLILLVGPSGCGKSAFARRHFSEYEIVSSDRCRGLVCDDENDQSATRAAFDVLHMLVTKRLQCGRLTVVDATNLRRESRRPLLELARRFNADAVAVAFDLPESVCQERNRGRPERVVGADVVHQQHARMERALEELPEEGFLSVHVIGDEPLESTAVVRERLPSNRTEERGPFDLIGDVHGCATELEMLLGRLGYEERGGRWRHPASRRAIFLGDLVDRGPRVSRVLRIAMDMVRQGVALCVPGNHDDKLLRALHGRPVRVAHGLQESLDSLAGEPPEFREAVIAFIEELPSHYVLDGGRLVVAHAGMKEWYQGRRSRRVRDFALYGETTGETDEFGLPVRLNWAAHYRGRAAVVYGHTPVHEPAWLNGAINIDTGCVFGGRLTALRYPEMELVSVPALDQYAVPSRPFLPEERLSA